jgi:hypothetical protein
MRSSENRGLISLESLDGEAKAAIRAMSDAMIVARSMEGRAAASVKPDTSLVTGPLLVCPARSCGSR